jgi:hypothetical protein
MRIVFNVLDSSYHSVVFLHDGKIDGSGVSDAEWQSEERSRYLTEYAKDRTAARAALAAFDPAQPLPPSACGKTP